VPLNPGTRIGPYEVLALLGAGGMGEVYRARDVKLNRDVAIKVLADVVAADPDRLARSRREAQVLASLNHPNIAHIYGVEDASAIHGLVMELVEGPTLADRVAQGPIPLDEALAIGKQITDALEAAHEQGIIHRDLKPANIKVRADGTVKVLDFGLAKLVDTTTASDVNVTASPTLSRHATMAGVILGTAAYMSPEQARGKAVDKRADIWAFGCVLYEMVTGRRAFGGDDVTETFAAIVRDQPDLSQAPAQLRRLLARCFEKDPRRRLRDIGDVWTLLDDEGRAQQHAVGPKAGATGSLPAWRRTFPWAVAAVAAVAAAGVSVVHLTETRFVPRPVRFQLQVPDEAGSTTPVISPDGTRLAYRFGGQIWIRDLGSIESRPIAPTDRAVGRFFWSADSRFVMYGAAGKLMRVPAAGGSSETLRDQPLPVAGGFGLPDGGIVVSSAAPLAGAAGETQRIDKSGAHPLSGIGLDMRGGGSLLPDGKRFLFAVLQPEASRGVYVASIDNAGAPERILSDASDVAYVSSARDGNEGYLLVQRQDSLVALPVDAARLRTRGEPIVLATGVGGFTASAGDSLVYRTAAGRRLTWYDRKGVTTGTAWSPGPFNELALSADGTRVVVVRADGPTTWVHEFAKESSTRVASGLRATIKPL
jgi:eukaryotic-like serine/threonine-protein kinase